MKKIILTISILASITFFTGCKKKEATKPNIENPSVVDKDSAQFMIVRYDQNEFGFDSQNSLDYKINDSMFETIYAWSKNVPENTIDTVTFKIKRGHTYWYNAFPISSIVSYKIFIDNQLIINVNHCITNDCNGYIFDVN